MHLAYQLARLMDLQGYAVEASVALARLKRELGDNGLIEARLRSLEEELAWAHARELDAPTPVPVHPADARAQQATPRTDGWHARYLRRKGPAPGATTPQPTPTPPHSAPTLGLYDHLRDPDLLWASFQRVDQNQGGPGGDGVTLEQFWAQVAQEFKAIGSELASHSYAPGAPAIRVVSKPGGGKRRLCVPCVRDRVVLGAAAMVLQDVYEPRFAACSYAYRPGRSVQQALQDLRRLLKSGLRWVVDADISACFDSISHEVLLGQLRRDIEDADLLDFLAVVLPPFATPQHPDQGIAQGSPLSPVLCNIYLNVFDHSAIARDIPLVRYADDFVLLAPDYATAHNHRGWAEHYLAERLRLQLNAEKTRVRSCDDGLEFLGQIVRA